MNAPAHISQDDRQYFTNLAREIVFLLAITGAPLLFLLP